MGLGHIYIYILGYYSFDIEFLLAQYSLCRLKNKVRTVRYLSECSIPTLTFAF